MFHFDSNRCAFICIVAIALLWAPHRASGLDVKKLPAQQLLQAITYSNSPIAGMHDTLGGLQAYGFNDVTSLCGQQPKLWSTDFGFSTHPNDSFRLRPDILTKARKRAAQDVLFMLSWHQCNPTTDEPCTFLDGVQKQLTDKQWKELFLDGSKLNIRWKKQMDVLASYLKVLQREGIPVLFRPYHESNIPGFWWASGNAQNSKRLWKQLYEYYTYHHGLNNLLWVWSASYHPKYWSRVSEYYPGDNVVDLIGLDIYPPSKTGNPEFKLAWESLKIISKNKPIGLSEVSKLPTKDELTARSWAFVVPWGINMLKRDNTENDICNIFFLE